jgi:serine phosphatase RsbU (regulator of sigma subunit)
VARTSWPSTELELPERWALLLHTDGLIDGRIGGGAERLGGEGLAELVWAEMRGHPDWRTDPGSLVDAVIARAEALNGGDLVDDVAVLLVGALPRTSGGRP